jgi:ATP-dependent Clp protease ATP-binding subunit ClpA
MIFNRFTRSARSCVESAVEEARSLGHDSIGDEDLLLGILESDDGNAAEAAREQADRLCADALASVGISFDEIRRQAGEAFEMRSPASARLPFSPSAKKALEQALRETIRLRDNKITAEHVLLGILHNEYGQAVRLLAGMDIPVREVEERLNQLRSRSPLR